ncbi:paramyosin-like [Schistocerca nitens]|uniref:paramyosin-like n=1 Tax=Schistocerca nitens TaxID=7011 RepID=UPI0021196785|nr:paramyosin-like [Schistocerca nitens]
MLVDLIKKTNESLKGLQESNASLEKGSQETRESLKVLQENNASLEKGLRESLKEDLRESLEKGLQETRESLKEYLQEARERDEIFRKSLKEDLQETIAQEIKTSYMEMECNLKKEMQELPERLKMNIGERESKLQKNIDQVQGDVEKMEGKLTRKIEDNIEETKAELGERITEVTQMQKQCNDAFKGIGDRQNQLPVNLRNAIAVQREEDNQRVAMEGEAFTWGVRKKEGTTSYDQFEEEFLKKYWSKSHQCAAIEDLLHRKSLSTWRGTLREFAEHLWELNETLEQPLSNDVMVSAIKRRLNQRMQETVSGSLIKDREALMEILEQLESVRSQEHHQANDRNREGSNDPRNPFNHSSDYRGRGGGTGKLNDPPGEVRSRVRATRTQQTY